MQKVVKIAALENQFKINILARELVRCAGAVPFICQFQPCEQVSNYVCQENLLTPNVIDFSGPTEISAGQLEVALGEHSLKSTDGVTFIRVTKIHLHPEYRCPKFVNDVALLELIEDIQWSPAVAPACLPYAAGYVATAYSTSEATAAGWGWMSEQHAIGKSHDKQKLPTAINKL